MPTLFDATVVMAIVGAASIALLKLVNWLTYREPRTYLAKNYPVGTIAEYTGEPPTPPTIKEPEKSGPLERARTPEKGGLRRFHLARALDVLIEEKARELIERDKRMAKFFKPLKAVSKKAKTKKRGANSGKGT